MDPVAKHLGDATMPKLKRPLDSMIQESIDAMYTHVDGDYVQCHIEAAKWSNRSIEASARYTDNAKKRAKPITKWIAWACKEAGVHHWIDAVHLIDHAKNPPEVAPYIVVKLLLPDIPHTKMTVTIHKPSIVAHVKQPIENAIKALLSMRDMPKLC